MTSAQLTPPLLPASFKSSARCSACWLPGASCFLGWWFERQTCVQMLCSESLPERLPMYLSCILISHQVKALYTAMACLHKVLHLSCPPAQLHGQLLCSLEFCSQRGLDRPAGQQLLVLLTRSGSVGSLRMLALLCCLGLGPEHGQRCAAALHVLQGGQRSCAAQGMES